MNVQDALKGQYHASLAMLKQAIEMCPNELWDGGSHPFVASVAPLVENVAPPPSAVRNSRGARRNLGAQSGLIMDRNPVPFWRVVYHTLYAAHMYLQQTEEDFRPWEHHRDGYNDLPWPPPTKPVCFPAGSRRSACSAAKKPLRSGPPDSGPKIDDPYTKAQMLEYWRLVDARVDVDVDRLDLVAPESGFSWHKTVPKLEHQIHNIRHIQHHAALLSGRLRLANGTDVRWVRTKGQVYSG